MLIQHWGSQPTLRSSALNQCWGSQPMLRISILNQPLKRYRFKVLNLLIELSWLHTDSYPPRFETPGQHHRHNLGKLNPPLQRGKPHNDIQPLVNNTSLIFQHWINIEKTQCLNFHIQHWFSVESKLKFQLGRWGICQWVTRLHAIFKISGLQWVLWTLEFMCFLTSHWFFGCNHNPGAVQV